MFVHACVSVNTGLGHGLVCTHLVLPSTERSSLHCLIDKLAWCIFLGAFLKSSLACSRELACIVVMSVGALRARPNGIEVWVRQTCVLE